MGTLPFTSAVSTLVVLLTFLYVSYLTVLASSYWNITIRFSFYCLIILFTLYCCCYDIPAVFVSSSWNSTILFLFFV